MMKHVRIALATVFVAGACVLAGLTVAAPVEPGPFTWREIADKLPASVQVFEGQATGPRGEAFRAWYAAIDYKDPGIIAKPFVVEEGAIGRKLPTKQAATAGALVAVNGGYFDVSKVPAETYSLVVCDGKILRENKSEIKRGGRRYFAARSAMGITQDRRFEMGWAFHALGKLWKVPRPIPAALKADEELPDFVRGTDQALQLWKVENAIGGGPRLVQNGKVHITFQEELFTGSGFQNEANYARTAVGWTRDNRLILLVVDGRQPGHSLGLTLTQLARMLISLGCVEAMNLDGGGSSAFVVNGKLLNRPSDGQERTTTSILAVVSSKAKS
jgi:hypothetical protein